jgi:ethanolamine utilization protein EutL
MKRIDPRILACRRLPHADPRLCAALGAPAGTQALAFVTCDQDDSLFAALDHATKMAEVKVVYARSFYAGAAHASGPLSGEAMGVLAAVDPDTLDHGVAALSRALAELYAFYAVAESGPTYFPTVIPSLGEYLSAQAGLSPGVPLGYFIAPPVEAMIGVDAALKVSRVELVKLFGPPTETNFAGAYVTGPLDAVEAAGQAFADAVGNVAARPNEA